ncbi:DMT family transporter [Candidatus Jidaibacter acanthamoebae]|nr:DMT family transporter [Candidatus Jidaibacter acanthamoeba]
MKGFRISNFYKEWGAFFIISFLGFGTSFFWIKVALRELTALELATYRITIASIALWCITPLFRVKIPTNIKLLAKITFLGVIGTFFPFMLTAWAEVYISSSVAGILNSLTPIFTIILSVFFLPDKELNTKLILSVILGFLGALLIFADKLNVDSEMEMILPELALIFCALCYATQAVYAKIHFKEQNFITLAVLSTTTAAILFWITLLMSQKEITFPQETSTIIAILWMAIVASTISLILLYYLIKSWTPTRVSFITYAVPIIAMFLGVAVLGEQLKAHMIIGAIIIIASIILSNQKLKRKAK